MFDINTLAAMQVGLASPEKIRSWSHGEITKPETINYRSQKPEPQGLFAEEIFGPAKDYECHCGKYKKIRFAGIVCERCHTEVTTKEVRRERMGHIELATPCTHIWYLKGIPSRMGLVLDISPKALEEVVYFTAHVCMDPGTSKVLYYKEFLDDRIGREVFITAVKEIQDTLPSDSADIEQSKVIISRLTNPNEPFDFFGTADFISDHTGAKFGEGAEAVKKLLQEVDLQKEFDTVSNDIKSASGQKLTKLTKRLEVLDAFIKSGINQNGWFLM